MNIKDCKIINLPKVLDVRGNLSFLEEGKQIPFEVKRSYWIYDVPGGEIRGGHSFTNNQEIIVALSGSFDVVLDDGSEKEVISLNRSYTGLFIPQMIWRHMENFSTNSLALIISSSVYNENDYERDYNKFLKGRAGSINAK